VISLVNMLKTSENYYVTAKQKIITFAIISC